MPLLGTEPRFLGRPFRGLLDILTEPSRRRNDGNDGGGQFGDKDDDDNDNTISLTCWFKRFLAQRRQPD